MGAGKRGPQDGAAHGADASSGLKHNPAEALRQAKAGPVVVLNRDNPDAVLIGLESSDLLQAPGVRAALATALFRDGALSARAVFAALHASDFRMAPEVIQAVLERCGE
ncbi:MAG: hypothetical protein ACK59G_05545 [Cyanobacteriota bacterium]